MNRKSLLFCILILILGISLLAGCGGGSGNGGAIKKGPSSDFMGLELNAVKTYNGIVNGVNKGNAVIKVLAEAEPSVFKTGTIEPGNSEPTYGDYIGVDGNTYHFRGEWDDTEDELEDTSQGIIMTNPITEGFVSDFYGKYVGKETVTTPVGKFEAYKFHIHEEGFDDEDDINWTDDFYTWFVPYLGYVMQYMVEKENDKISFEASVKMVAYSFPSGSRGTSNNYFSPQKSASKYDNNMGQDNKSTEKLRKIFR